MSLSAEAFEARAEECVKFANLTKDHVLQSELLALRQRYLETARRLRDPSLGIAITTIPDPTD